MASRLGPAKPRGRTWNGAGVCDIASQARQVNFSRTYCTTFHCRGTDSSVSVTSSPSLASLVEPQHAQAVGPGTMTRSRGRCAGNGLREGFSRVKPRTAVVSLAEAATFSGELVLGGGGFEFLQFELQLFEKPHLAFTARAVNLPPHLLDRQPQMRDQGRGARCLGTRPRKISLACANQPLKRLDIIGKRIISDHHHKRITRRGPCLSLRSCGDSQCRDQPAACGRHVYCGARQSIPERR